MMTKHKIRCTYEGFTEDEILLPAGVEIEKVSVKYGKMEIFVSTGETLNITGKQWIETIQSSPTQIDHFKIGPDLDNGSRVADI